MLWRRLRETLWTLDALLFVLGYTALLLLVPARLFPRPRKREH
jgi:hypothetical protein